MESVSLYCKSQSFFIPISIYNCNQWRLWQSYFNSWLTYETWFLSSFLRDINVVLRQMISIFIYSSFKQLFDRRSRIKHVWFEKKPVIRPPPLILLVWRPPWSLLAHPCVYNFHPNLGMRLVVLDSRPESATCTDYQLPIINWNHMPETNRPWCIVCKEMNLLKNIILKS